MTTVGERLAREFFERVWSPPHDLDAIDELMTPDYRITTAGQVIEGREAFKAWVGQMQTLVGNASNEHLDIITNAAGDKVVSRWITRGVNNGMIEVRAITERSCSRDNFEISSSVMPSAKYSFSASALMFVEDGRLSECWVERSAYELYRRLEAR